LPATAAAVPWDRLRGFAAAGHPWKGNVTAIGIQVPAAATATVSSRGDLALADRALAAPDLALPALAVRQRVDEVLVLVLLTSADLEWVVQASVRPDLDEASARPPAAATGREISAATATMMTTIETSVAAPIETMTTKSSGRFAVRGRPDVRPS